MANRSRRRGERAQTLMVFALGFTLFLFVLVCLVADGSYMYGWSSRVQAAAQLAAQSGADAVDPRYLYASSCAATDACTIVDVNPADRRNGRYAFERACIQAGDQSAAIPRDPPHDLAPKSPDDPQSPDGTSCASDGCHVWAGVTKLVDLPVPFPGFPSQLPVVGTARAAPVVGASAARAVCAGGAWVPAPPP